uniref:Uncharacterized protein n=1 Tax=Anguilla anguilla TaxID=7936 RepID=A0A0E9VS98_ANGAN
MFQFVLSGVGLKRRKPLLGGLFHK